MRRFDSRLWVFLRFGLTALSIGTIWAAQLRTAVTISGNRLGVGKNTPAFIDWICSPARGPSQ